jgi:hypothetical protein
VTHIRPTYIGTVTVPPSLGPSSVEVRAWLVRISSVEVLDNLSRVLQVFSALFGNVGMSSPFHSVLKTRLSSTPSVPARVYNVLNFPLLQAFYFHGGRRGLDLSWWRVFSGGSEQADIENGVDLYRCGQF